MPRDPAVILFTSGTTGPSKGAVLSHRANFGVASSTCGLMAYGEDEVLFNMFPLYHVNARYTSVLPAMWLDRGACVLHDRFSASRFWDICRAEGVTAFNFMGALVLMLFKQPERDDDADNPVRCAYGAPAPVAVLERFERRFGVELVEVYGSTELGACLQNSRGRAPDRLLRAARRRTTSSRSTTRTTTRSARGSRARSWSAPASRTSWWRSTSGRPRRAWLPSGTSGSTPGDRGRTDEDGWFYYVDRLKDAIRRRGENISSWEVEQVVNDHEAVAESAAIGIPSDLTEEEVMVVVVLQEGAELDTGGSPRLLPGSAPALRRAPLRPLRR